MAKKINTGVATPTKTSAPKVDENLIVPDFGNNNAATRRLPVVASTTDPLTAHFVYFFHPRRWCVIEGAVVPLLQEFRLVDGVDNFIHGRDGKPKMTKLRTNREEADWIMVAHNKAPGGTSYMRRHEARINGTNETTHIFLPVWAKPVAASQEIRIDLKGYRDWLVSLCADGFLPMPDPIIADEKIKMLSKQVIKADKTNPEVARMLRAELEVWQKLLASGEALDTGDDVAPEFDDE